MFRRALYDQGFKLFLIAAVCIVAGAWIIAGFGWALVALGVMAFAPSLLWDNPSTPTPPAPPIVSL